jgi:plasmid stabilization system protein ParE
MMRFWLTPDAEMDVDDITVYLQGLPQVPATRISLELQETLAAITRFPGLGRLDDELSELTKAKIQRLVSGQYIVFYYVALDSVRILGVLPGKSDIDGTMRRRLR